MGKFLTFLFILFVAAMAYFAVLNRDQVIIVLAEGHRYEIPKVALVLISSAIGALLMLFIFMLRDTKRFIISMQQQKRTRKSDKVKALYEKALDAYFAEKWDDAKSVFEQILKEDPEHINSILKLGDLAFNNMDYKTAIEHYSHAHAIDPDKAEILFALIRGKRAIGAVEEALTHADDILDSDHDNIRALYTKRELLEKLDRWDDVVLLQKNIIKKRHTDSEKEEEQDRLKGYKYEYGRASLENGELEKAEKAFRTVLKLDNDFVPAHLGLAEVMFREEHTEEAIGYLETVYAQTKSLIILARLEDLLINIGEPSRLIRTYKTSLSNEPDNNTLKLFMGKLYHRLEMLDDALEVLDTIDSASSYPEVSKIRGNIYKKRNQPEKAVEEFKRVADMKKAFRIPYCCSNCGYFSVDWAGRCPSCKEWDTFKFDIFASCKFETD